MVQRNLYEILVDLPRAKTVWVGGEEITASGWLLG